MATQLQETTTAQLLEDELRLHLDTYIKDPGCINYVNVKEAMRCFAKHLDRRL